VWVARQRQIKAHRFKNQLAAYPGLYRAKSWLIPLPLMNRVLIGRCRPCSNCRSARSQVRQKLRDGNDGAARSLREREAGALRTRQTSWSTPGDIVSAERPGCFCAWLGFGELDVETETVRRTRIALAWLSEAGIALIGTDPTRDHRAEKTACHPKSSVVARSPLRSDREDPTRSHQSSPREMGERTNFGVDTPPVLRYLHAVSPIRSRRSDACERSTIRVFHFGLASTKKGRGEL
jgi:hypothetical protein